MTRNYILKDPVKLHWVNGFILLICLFFAKHRNLTYICIGRVEVLKLLHDTLKLEIMCQAINLIMVSKRQQRVNLLLIHIQISN